MKKIVLQVALMVFSFTVSAQTIIPKIGFSVSKIASSEADEDSEIKSKLGLMLGAAVEIPIKNSFSLQPEILYIQKGVKSSASEDDFSYEYKETVNYLEIPVLFKVSFGEGTKFYVNAGPSLAFAIGGKWTSEESFDGDTESDSGKLKFGTGDEADYKGMDIGLQIGGGALIADKFMIDLRYGVGLSSIATSNEGNYWEKNRAIQVTFGVPLNVFN